MASKSNQNQNVSSKTILDLMEKVGNKGKYQEKIFYIFVLIFISTGVILMSSQFIFMNSQYLCQDKGLLIQTCKEVVCQINDHEERLKYFTKNKEKIQSIATDYGPFICENEYLLDIIKSFPYFGSFIGSVIASFVSDRIGRKLTMDIFLGVAALGSILMSVGFNLWLIGLGVILSGAGINVCSAICFVYLGEIVESVKRQKYSILVQISYTVGTMLLTGCYYLIGNWRVNTIILQTVPITVTFFLFTFYAEDTPLYLLKQSNEKALKALNRIGYINFGIKQILTKEDLQEVRVEHFINKGKNDEGISPLDLFKFNSLRKITILSSILGYIVLTMYYGPTIIVESIGFNTYMSSFVIQLSQLIGNIPCYFLIDKVKRKKAGFYLFLVSVLSSLILIFLKKPSDCNLCIESIIEVMVIFVFRFAIATYYMLFLIYNVEIFPIRAVGVGVNWVNSVGALATCAGPIIIGVLERLEFNLMIFFFILGIIGGSLTLLLNQTHNKSIQTQIQEIAFIKKQSKLLYDTSVKQEDDLNE